METQARNFTTNVKVNIDLYIPKLTAVKVVICLCEMYDSTECRYSIILIRDILTYLVI